jgi:hypothetical protein
MFNMPLTNALNGTIDPSTGFDACPISQTSTNNGAPAPAGSPGSQTVAAGAIIVCPQFESDGKTASPLTGQVVVRNLMQGKFTLIAHPGAAREAAGEEWLQTNSLDGGHFLDSFIKVGEPPYFQEFGPGGYHVFFGFANPKHINSRLAAICNGQAANLGFDTPYSATCRNTLNGQVTNLHQARSPVEQLATGNVFPQGDPGNYAPLTYTTCFAAIGDTDGATIGLTKCDANGNFSFPDAAMKAAGIKGLPDGTYGVVIFDQWNDYIVDGSSRAVTLSGGQTQNVTYPVFTWQTHLWSRAYMDTQGKGAPNLLPDGTLDPATSPGLIQVPTRVRQTNGKFVNTLLSDIAGNSRFDETFPLFAWYTVESDTTRFRGTGVHVVNDAGGTVDGPTPIGNGITTGPYRGVLNSIESFALPPALRVPGAVYCPQGDAVCATTNLKTNPTGNGSTAGSCGTPPAGAPAGTTNCTGLSTARIDPGSVDVEGWQGGVSEFDMVDWGKTPYMVGENGGIRGHVVNATTRPFDDPRMLFQNLWEPLVPRVTVNLYLEGTAPDGSTSLTLVDTTQTSSWDDWAQGFAQGGRPAGIPNMSCPGQDPTDPFFSITLAGTKNYLNPGATATANVLPNDSQFKCYDGYHNLNQIQPATYDGLFKFPSQACLAAPAAGHAEPTFFLTGNMTAYNCVTVPNPAFTAKQPGAAPRILPPGKYVTEVILPQGWQLNKEEDLNLLIGDQYIAPATSQFVTLANIFITPDQASIDAANLSYTGPYTGTAGVNGTSGAYNQPFIGTFYAGSTTNNGKQSTNYGRTSFGNFGPGGLIVQSAPCVGRMRIVPDYLSISPESGEVAPFAGSLRPLCDRKEITVSDEMQADVDFYIYTMTPIATTFTGFISDDFSSEFDPASPAFGEKFAVTNVPVSIRDFNGNEISRIYSDQWGVFNGLVYSTWEVDPPNITGYSPNMMVTCMNDPGPILDTRATIPNASGAAIPNPTFGKMIQDPQYNPAYSNFCYENPFMPGDTVYLDTPVVPVSAFAEGYNPPDCAYPDGTPMISSVTGDAIGGGPGGPWVASAGSSITINALAPTTLAAPANGTSVGAGLPVPNNAYSGPGASTAPYNQKFVTRHYGFGASGSVTIGGVTATCGTWTDAQLVCTVPSGVPLCSASNPSYTGANASAQCGELVITAANGKQSIDTVTVTIGGSTPTYVNGENAASNAIQTAIDSANPGDLVIVGPGHYNEMLLMWKPIRLQGVGDGAVTVDGNTHPSDKLLPRWRRQVNCLFGLALNGGYLDTDPNAVRSNGTSAYNPYDASNAYSCSFGTFTGYTFAPGAITYQALVDPIPGEPIIGWDATLNGNLAELLQEPTLMGAYEGAGITVLAKGLEDNNTTNCTPEGAAGCIPLNNLIGTVANNGFNNGVGDCDPSSSFAASNYLCNPSRVDGFTFTNSSQGGGGIFVHGFAHNLEVANNHVTGNGGTLTGGITVGQMEVVDPTYAATNIAPPGAPAHIVNMPAPLNLNAHVNVHNNAVTFNAAYGDELNSNTPASAGGVTFCNGADYYKFQYNWVCGNWSSGDGGGVAHHGLSFNGDIENNWIVFNQSINPSLVTYGGGLIALGAAPDGTVGEAGLPFDVDVAPALSDGVGPGLVIKGNVLQGNTAEEGSGGGLALMHVNGGDVANNPTDPTAWYKITVQNNIFANNVAGWAGGGVALLDALNVDFTNNTVASNDSTSSAGVEFNSNGAPNGNIPPPAPPGSSGPPCNPTGTTNVPNPGCGPGFTFTTSVPLPAGLVTEYNSANMTAVFSGLTAAQAAQVTCPVGHGTGTGGSAQCAKFSVPNLDHDIFWQNRSFNITTTSSPTGSAQLNPALIQATTGACTYGTGSGTPNYWDIGVYSDKSPTTHESGLTLQPTNSIVGTGSYSGNSSSNPGFGAQYCNGSRVPPEIAPQLCTSTAAHPTGGIANAQGCIQPGTLGVSMTVPGGVPDSLTPPLPAFTISPAATIDEGNNWINMFYGPLSSTCSISTGCGAVPFNGPLGNYTASGAANAGASLPAPYPNP